MVSRKCRRGLFITFGLVILGMLSACSSYPPAAPGVALPDSVSVADGPRSIELRAPGTQPDSPGLIFYPGGLVEPEAYVSILAPVAAAGFPVVIVKMPLDLAVTAPRRAEETLDPDRQDDSARPWVLAGHSLGGAMAARFVVREGDRYGRLRGLVLLGAYPPGNDSLAGLGYPVLSIWASEDGLATGSDRSETAHLLPADARVVIIDGGNHAGFGDYGPQKGDGVRLIPLQDQHQQVQHLIIEFLSGVVQ